MLMVLVQMSGGGAVNECVFYPNIPFRTGHKKIVNFSYPYPRLSTNLYYKINKLTIARGHSHFLFVVLLKLSRFRIPKEKRKRFLTM